MNKYRQEYNEKKEKVLNLLNSTKEYYEKYEEKRKIEVFDEIIETVKQDEFSIVLVGEFSAGKSTFLNALMGEKILPSFTRETTATINYLRHKDRAENGEEGRVYFSDGTVEVLDKVDFKTINKYVSTESDVDVATKVEHVDLFLDSRFLEGNVTLVDSPGLNGTAEGHRKVTEDQIEKSSASIFMFKADQPGSDTDFKFIGELKDRINTIIFALNKIDEIKESEGETVESVIESLKSIYKQKFPEANSIPKIWGISAYQALVARSNQKLDYRGRNDYTLEEKEILEQQSRMGAFEDRLWQFITKGEKARAMLLSPVSKVINSLNEFKISIQENLDILESKNDKEEIEKRIEEINIQKDSIQNKINNIEFEIEDDLEISMSEFIDSVKVRLEKIKENQIDKLNDWENLEELMDIEHDLESDIQRSYKNVFVKCERDFKNTMRKIINQNYREVAKSINEDLKNLDFKISVDAKYEPTQSDFELGIKEYEEEQEKIELEIKGLEDKLYQEKENKLKIRKIEREKKKLEDEINKIKDLKEIYKTTVAPKKEFISEQEYEKQSRGGIIGGIANIFIGKKNVPVTKHILVNEEEIEEYNKSKKEKIDSYDRNIQKLEEEEKKLNNQLQNSEGSEIYELRMEKINKDKQELINKKRSEQEKFKKNFESKNKTAFRKKKKEIERYIDEINEEFSQKMETKIYKEKENLLDVIKSSIGNNLKIKLEEKNNELLILNNKLESSQEEKKLYKERYSTMIKDIEGILNVATELNADLESEPIDEMEEEML